MENIDVIIRNVCQELYDNLRHNNSIFSHIKSTRYIKKLEKINIRSDYKYSELIRDEIGLLYKNYMVFCKKEEYDSNINIIRKIYNMYVDLCMQIEEFLVGNESRANVSEYRKIEDYIRILDKTYGGQTHKYIKKLSKKKLGAQANQIKNVYKDKSKIISEKKKDVMNILQEKLDRWNGVTKKERNIEIVYNSENAEYIIVKLKNHSITGRKKLRFKPNFADIDALRQKALKNLKQLNFNIDIYKELNINKTMLKYADPFILSIFCSENYLDYAKIYLRQISGNTNIKKEQLPFKIKYKINKNYYTGKMTPVRNEIMAIIAERSSLTVAYLKNI